MNKANIELICEQANSLANLVKNSPEYIQFMAAKEKLESDEMNKQVLQDLREQQLTMHFSKMSSEDFDKRNHFVNEMYMAVSLNPVISDYLNAEYKFSKIMKELSKIFGDILLDDEGDSASDFNGFEDSMAGSHSGSDYLN